MQAPSASRILASGQGSHFEVVAIDMPDMVSLRMRTAKSLARRLEASVRQVTTDPDFSRLHGPEYLIRRLVLVAATLVALAPGAVGAEGESMLYLVEFEATEAGALTTRDHAIELREEFIIPSLERLEGDDKIRGGGLFVLARAGASWSGRKPMMR